MINHIAFTKIEIEDQMGRQIYKHIFKRKALNPEITVNAIFNRQFIER